MRRGWVIGGAAALVTVALEVAFRHAAHPVLAWHSVPAFDLAYGFLGCALIVVASKALGRLGIQRPEDYYRDED
ncbi:MAG TPA: hypothetical protein VLI67_09405 [Vicinamibacteria bacterium]|nr:hypothetical protein [Vicinamibacteria bacterium]